MLHGKRAIAYALFAVLLLVKPSWSAQLLDTPVYDPDTKSYFELVAGMPLLAKGSYGSNEGPTWAGANKFAQQRVYKGVQGRLAVIQSVATHFFLSRTFQPDSYSWIGLLYWCERRVGQWSDGQHLTPEKFQAWAPDWKQEFMCNGAGPDPKGMQVYAGIAYTSADDGFQWIAEGPAKRFYYFFVEYPTGHP